MKMYISGRWTTSRESVELRFPYDGHVLGTVPSATPDQVDEAVASAGRGAGEMARLDRHRRAEVLRRAADLVEQRASEIATSISEEVGKPIVEARAEVARVPDLIRLSAFEGTQARGESLPLDAQKGASSKLGITLRVPCGVVVAVTPFNYPLLLVVHKVAPALAAGNAVILKPASSAPSAAIKLTEILLEAGLPPEGIQCLTGPGRSVVGQLVQARAVRMVTFTGSASVGHDVAALAAGKRVSLELGANCPMVVLRDADIASVAAATAVGGYANAGQVCISTQRILVDASIHGEFVDALRPLVRAIPVGHPLEETTRLGSLISQPEAERVERWIGEAVTMGAQVMEGGSRRGAVHEPTVVDAVPIEARLFREELFGPAVAITEVSGLDEAIALADQGSYGLAASIWTRDLDAALAFIDRVGAGIVHVNSTPTWRADLMPYGGVKDSGFGREGPRYVVEAMTEMKTVVLHGGYA